MAVNPMQRKSRNSLIIGVVVTFLIMAIICGIILKAMMDTQKQLQDEKGRQGKVYVLARDIKSGEEIADEDLIQVNYYAGSAPANALQVVPVQIETDEEGTEYTSYPKAVIDLSAGTPLTESMLYYNTLIGKDLRKQEYNGILMNSQLESDSVIDVRLKLPNGTDYIVVANKTVTIPEVAGVPLAGTIQLVVSEDERLLMDCAIIDSYRIPGATLYATDYVQAGVQTNDLGGETDRKTKITYVPSTEVLDLLNSDPNVLNSARAALKADYGENASKYRQSIQDAINNSGLDRDDINDAIVDGVNESKTTTIEARQLYVDSLAE